MNKESEVFNFYFASNFWIKEIDVYIGKDRTNMDKVKLHLLIGEE